MGLELRCNGKHIHQVKNHYEIPVSFGQIATATIVIPRVVADAFEKKYGTSMAKSEFLVDVKLEANEDGFDDPDKPAKHLFGFLYFLDNVRKYNG